MARIQSAAVAQRELDMQRMKTRQKRGKQDPLPPAGILNLRAQMPTHTEFFEIFQKFKLSFNILVSHFSKDRLRKVVLDIGKRLHS